MKPKNIEVATVTYLLRGNKICLARKKQEIHTAGGLSLDNSAQTWNGYGGKVEKSDKSIRHTAVRELFDESGVKALTQNLIPTGKISFFWLGNDSDTPNMIVYFFLLYVFEGEPKETNEMGAPIFFTQDIIPYHEMMSADKVFLPKMLSGEKIIADISFRNEKRDKTFHIKYEDEKLEV
jgi:ADP-ribose pyrophosphatase YjhB (NUDIX family)